MARDAQYQASPCHPTPYPLYWFGVGGKHIAPYASGIFEKNLSYC
jgi:hypothetical protein